MMHPMYHNTNGNLVDTTDEIVIIIMEDQLFHSLNYTNDRKVYIVTIILDDSRIYEIAVCHHTVTCIKIANTDLSDTRIHYNKGIVFSIVMDLLVVYFQPYKGSNIFYFQMEPEITRINNPNG